MNAPQTTKWPQNMCAACEKKFYGLGHSCLSCLKEKWVAEKRGLFYGDPKRQKDIIKSYSHQLKNNGLLRPKPCRCGEPASKTEMHHPDPLDPFEVKFMCRWFRAALLSSGKNGSRKIIYRHPPPQRAIETNGLTLGLTFEQYEEIERRAALAKVSVNKYLEGKIIGF